MTIYAKWFFLIVFLAGLGLGQGAKAQSTDMRVTSVSANCAVVLTTGTKFSFTPNEVKVEIRLDTTTNDYYAVGNRPIAYQLTSNATFVDSGGNTVGIFSGLVSNYDDNVCDGNLKLAGDSEIEFLPSVVKEIDGSLKKVAVLQNDHVKFEIHDSGLMFVTAKGQRFAYNHIADFPTNKLGEIEYKKGAELDRMWANAKGGSLHAFVTGQAVHLSSPDDKTVINLYPNATMAHMSFPPRKYDFKKLYGTGERPFVQTIGGARLKKFYTLDSSQNPILTQPRDAVFNYFSDRHVGVFFVSSGIYKGKIEDDTGLITTPATTRPITLTSSIPAPVGIDIDGDGNVGGDRDKITRGYEIKDMGMSNLFTSFVQEAHARGFKVITYTIGPRINNWCLDRRYLDSDGARKYGLYIEQCSNSSVAAISDFLGEGGIEGNGINYTNHQWANKVLAWMNHFQKEYNTDGWYIDGPIVGDFLDDYDFTRKLRQQVDENNNDDVNYPEIKGNILLYHDSIDPWSENNVNLLGLKAIFLRTYADYSLSGEIGSHAIVSKPNDEYYKYYTNGYGMDQALCSHKLFSAGTAKLQEEDNARALGENYYCAHRSKSVKIGDVDDGAGGQISGLVIQDDTWTNYFLPKHKVVRDNFDNLTFAPPVLPTSLDWYSDFNVQNITVTSVEDINNPTGNFSFEVEWDLVGVTCSHSEPNNNNKNLDFGFETFRGAKIALDEGANTNWEKKHEWLKVSPPVPQGPLANRVEAGTLIATTISDTNTWKHIANFNGVPSGDYKLMIRCETYDPNVSLQKVLQYSNNTLSVDAAGNVTTP